MSVYKDQVEMQSTEGTTSYFDITPQVRAAIEKSGIKEGICVAISPHTTCGVFFEEFVHDLTEDGNDFLQADLNDVLKKIIPDHIEMDQYRYPGPDHFEAVSHWPDQEKWLPGGDRSLLRNGDAHLRATIIGSSQTFEVTDGKLALSETGYIFFVDFDRNRSRTRKCRIVIIGE